MWRNWQTRRSQTPVDTTSLWVQIPSSAPKGIAVLAMPFPFATALYFTFTGVVFNFLRVPSCWQPKIFVTLKHNLIFGPTAPLAPSLFRPPDALGAKPIIRTKRPCRFSAGALPFTTVLYFTLSGIVFNFLRVPSCWQPKIFVTLKHNLIFGPTAPLAPSLFRPLDALGAKPIIRTKGHCSFGNALSFCFFTFIRTKRPCGFSAGALHCSF